MSQVIYNPADFEFTWIQDDTPTGWYVWHRDLAHRLALKARNSYALNLKAQGYSPKKFSIRNQQITRGGIGSSHPEITLWATCYGINY